MTGAAFARKIPRAWVLALGIAALCLLPPEAVSQGPDLCLWRHLFHLSACPACGTTRALSAFFHGRFAEALAFNRNVAVTAPGVVSMFALDVSRALRRWLA